MKTKSSKNERTDAPIKRPSQPPIFAEIKDLIIGMISFGLKPVQKVKQISWLLKINLTYFNLKILRVSTLGSC